MICTENYTHQMSTEECSSGHSVERVGAVTLKLIMEEYISASLHSHNTAHELVNVFCWAEKTQKSCLLLGFRY